ncbi:MAG: hypothetical protein V7K71_19340 [Nostoc sp.]
MFESLIEIYSDRSHSAIGSYASIIYLEAMFRDIKIGGYKLEDTNI